MDIEKTLQRMSLQQKVSICSGATNWLSKGFNDLGIRPIFMANGSYGAIVVKNDRDTSIMARIKKTVELASTLLKISDIPFMGKVEPSTSFPCSTSIACTWNKQLVGEVGKAIGEECNEMGVDVLLGPGINLKRSPLCGRNFEYYSEDPYLIGETGKAFILGVQGEGVAVSLKHFALNNTEYRRFSIDTLVDERTLHEIYLSGFEKIVREAHPMTVMAAYNQVNGEFASESHHLLTEILREEWGFDGLVMSDWGAINDRVKSVKAGCDLEMPGPKAENDAAILSAVNNGEIDQQAIDIAARRVLELIEKTSHRKSKPVDYSKHHQLAIQTAEEGMVLLKNNGILPLDVKKVKSLAVIGEIAKTPNYLRRGQRLYDPEEAGSAVGVYSNICRT